MKSMRLNKELRKSILNNFEKHYDNVHVKPEEPKSSNELDSELAEGIRQELLSRVPGLDKIPVNYLRTSTNIRTRFPNGYITSPYFLTETDSYDPRVVPALDGVFDIKATADYWVKCVKDKEAIDVIRSTFNEHMTKRGAWIEKISNILDSVNTTGQFVEIWPEAEPFIPEDIRDPSVINLPSVSLEELNRFL